MKGEEQPNEGVEFSFGLTHHGLLRLGYGAYEKRSDHSISAAIDKFVWVITM